MFHITPKSKNAKVGKMAVTTSTATTCPSACPFKDNGCYADGYPLKGHWIKVTEGERGDDWPTFIRCSWVWYAISSACVVFIALTTTLSG